MTPYRFHGQFDPPVDRYLFERFFPELRDGLAIECGAFDGVLESSCLFFEESRGWRTVNVEPSPPVFARLEANRPRAINLRAALSDNAGTARFRHAVSPICGDHFGNGSLTHQPEHLEDLVGRGCHFDEYQVRTLTYGELLAETGVGRPDLLVLDVEGHELQVLEGMRRSTLLPRVLCVEHGHFGVEKMRTALAGLPFRFDSSLHVNSFYVNEQHPPRKPSTLQRLWQRTCGL